MVLDSNHQLQLPVGLMIMRMNNLLYNTLCDYVMILSSLGKPGILLTYDIFNLSWVYGMHLHYKLSCTRVQSSLSYFLKEKKKYSIFGTGLSSFIYDLHSGINRFTKMNPYSPSFKTGKWALLGGRNARMLPWYQHPQPGKQAYLR